MNAAGKGAHTRHQSPFIVIRRIGRIGRAVDDLRQNLKERRKVWETAWIAGKLQIPAAGFIGSFHGFVQNGRHGRIHGPAGIENFYQTVDMFQNMDIIGEAEGIELQQIRILIRVGTVNCRFFIAAEDILIFPLRRFNDQPGHVMHLQAAQQFIDGIRFADARGTGNESMGRQSRERQFDRIAFIFFSHVIDIT